MNRSPLPKPALLLIPVALVIGFAGVASADCMGPTINYSGGEVAHGDIVKVTGSGFGDNCYDTGPPPPGIGALGIPLEGVEVYIEQAGARHLVAVGDTSLDYSWSVDVRVPLVLDVGEARITAVTGRLTAFDESNSPLEVTSQVVEGAAVTVVDFGENAESPKADPEPTTTDWTPLLALIAGLAVVAVVGVTTQRRRSG